MSTHDTIAQQVIDHLATHGLAATFEYPGTVVVKVSETEEVWTGLNGWDYGSFAEHRNGMMQPREDVTAEPEGIEENSTDAKAIAAAWAAWVISYRNSARG